MKITLFFLLISGLFFSFLLFPETAYACVRTNPDGTPANRTLDDNTCSQYTCASGPPPAGWYTGRVTYTYTDGTSCSQTQFFTTNQCTVNQTGSDPCPSGCTSDGGCVTGAYCTGGISFNYCTEARSSRNGTWCEAWNCGASCDNTTGCQPWPVCDTAPCAAAAPYTSVDTCNAAKTANGGLCPGTPTSTPTPANTPTPTPTSTPGPTPTPTPTSTPGPTPTPTPIGCVSCGTGGICTAEPPAAANAVSPSCPPCPGNSWEYLGDAISASVCQANPLISDLYPWCYRCTTALPTPTPTSGPTPTSTPAVGNPSCLNYLAITSPSTNNMCGPGSAPADDDDPSTPPISFTQVSYWTYISCCDPYLIGSVYCGQVGGADYGRWQRSCSIPVIAPTATPITYAISGIVFIDRNDNDRQDTGEIGYSGARLFLGTRSATTDATGAYQFASIISGDYTLELDVPFGFSPERSTGWNAATGTNKLAFNIPRAAGSSIAFGIVPYEVGVGGTMYTTLEDNCSTGITSIGRLGSKALSLSEIYFGLNWSRSSDGTGNYSFSYPYSATEPVLFPGRYVLTPLNVTGARLICAVFDPGTAGAWSMPVGSAPFSQDFYLTAAIAQRRIDFYFQLAQPWFQGKGGDMRIDSGFIDRVWAAAHDPYAMLSNRRSPGVIFSGDNRYSFCITGAGICLERASPLANPWVAGGTTYPETFTPAIPGTTRTSYSYLLGLVRQNGQPIIEIDESTCYDQSGCDLAALDPDIVYTNAPNRDVYISRSTFNRGDYVFLINGNLHIQEEIQTVRTPNASTLVISVSGDIIVNKDVGGSPSSPSTHIEGLFSADGSFIIKSNSTDGVVGSNCSSIADKRLNMAGSVVVNAGFSTGGTFNNRRSLCSDNDYPTVKIEERPDFILNAPDILKHPSSVWQEVAP